ncbi:MAG: apolipoprotein N-acyltransferase [Deltaproteobacteria bacterium]|nr:apolipoprotein N-acyltransferase [Deltaproteobacteria bacterium]
MALRIFLLPLLSGTLYWLSSPAGSFPLAVWCCLVPLGFSLSRTSPGKGLAAGFVYGFLIWLVSVWWLKISLSHMAGLPPWQAWCGVILFCAFYALPYALWGWLAGRFRLLESHTGTWFAAATLVVIRTWYPHVFPGSEAHNLYVLPLFLQVLDLGGAPLLLFFIYLVNLQIVRIFTARRSASSPLPALLTIAAAFVFLAAYGGYRLQTLHAQMETAAPGRQMTVISIQPNIPIGREYREDVPPADRGNDVHTALAMSAEAARLHPAAELIVWPENPSFYDCHSEVRRDIFPLARQTCKAVMLPCTSVSADKGKSARYQSVHVIGKDGPMGGEYRKLILMPFGEYLPLEKQFPFLRKIFPGVMNYEAANRGEALYDFGRNRRLYPALCYESIFTGHSRRFVEQGGNVLINMIDDAWYGKSPASLIHMSLALFRTVEYRIPFVAVNNAGVGLFVQPTGEIVPGSRTPLFQKAATAHRLYIPPERSPYARWGDAFLYGLTALFILGLVGLCLSRYSVRAKGISKNDFMTKQSP